MSNEEDGFWKRINISKKPIIEVDKMNFSILSLRIFHTDKAKLSEDSRNVIPYLVVFTKLKYVIYSKHR